MKAHLLQVLVVDNNCIGLDEIIRVFEQDTDYRDLINPHVIKSQSVQINDWDDSNLLNHIDTQVEEVERLFSPLQPMSTAPKHKRILVFFKDGSTFISTIYEGDYVTLNTALGWMPLPNHPLARC